VWPFGIVGGGRSEVVCGLVKGDCCSKQRIVLLEAKCFAEGLQQVFLRLSKVEEGEDSQRRRSFQRKTNERSYEGASILSRAVVTRLRFVLGTSR
jgi:hypothetical protein